MDARTVRELLDYDPDTGIFRWKVNVGDKMRAGSRAGTGHTRGYWRITINYKRYYAHRIAWLYVHGVMPTLHIDHIDGDTSNNRIANLRQATRSQNLGNARLHKDSTSGFKGVSWHIGLGKWIANIQRDNRSEFLGSYDSAEEAHSAYTEAADRLFQEFARTG